MTAVSACACLLLSTPSSADVRLPAGATEGARWAADCVGKTAKDARVSCALVQRPELGQEGFRLSSQGGTIQVEARTWAGLMYGLLELDRRARCGQTLAVRAGQTSVPDLWLRAVSRNAELWLDIGLYDDAFRGYAAHDRSTDWWFHSEAAWRETFRRLAREGLNGIVLVHPHIFPAFLDYSSAYPEAAYLKPDELAAKQQALRMAIRLGREYNVTIHWLRWNIWVPRGFAEAHGIRQDGVDSGLTREFEAWCVAEFHRSFPGFGSIITQCGESPPGCAEFIANATVGGLRRVEPRPRLIVWNWCANPPDVQAIIDAYDGPTSVMGYLQYEQLFTDRADPRIGAFSKALGGVGMVALGGPKSANAYLFWGSPSWSRGLMHSLHADDRGEGIIIECTEPADRWLAEEALAHYAWDASGPYDEKRWLGEIADRYGSSTIARPLLSAMESASRIIGRQLMLTHSQSGAFMPQLGLSLAQCLEMPSITDYVFEDAVEKDAQGYLTPRMGLCWSSADFDWGERVVPVRQFAITLLAGGRQRDDAMRAWRESRRPLGFAPSRPQPGDVQPPRIASELEQLARRTDEATSRVERMLPSPTRPEELGRVVRLLRANAALARYFAARDRLAIAWERYRLTGAASQREAAQAETGASLSAWSAYAEWLKQIHGDHLWGYVSTISHPTPWSQLDLWRGYRNAPWEIDDLTALWEREAEVLRERLRSWPHETLEPPVFDELRALAPGARTVYIVDFEREEPGRWELVTRWTPDVAVTRDPALVISGKASLMADSRHSNSEWNEFFVTLPAGMPLRPGATYQVALKYQVVAESDGYRSPFGIAFRTAKGGGVNEKGDARVWGAHPGAVHERIMEGQLGDFDDYFLFFSIHGRAAIVIDDVRIAEVALRAKTGA